MKLIYILGFNIAGEGGQHKVSAEKALSMTQILGGDNIQIWFPKSSSNKWIGYFYILIFDFVSAFKLVFLPRGTYRIIYRVIFFPLSNAIIRWKKIPSAYEVHADFAGEIHLVNKSKFEKLLLKAMIFFDRMNFRLSSGIIYNHPFLLNKFNKVYFKPSIFTYNGVNPDKFRPLDILTVRRELNIPKNSKVALFLGSISKWHGVDLVIHAFLKEELLNSEIDFYIVGATSSKYVNDLKYLASLNPRIKFIDKVTSDIAVKYINASDICLLPVKNIRTSPGSPLKLYEYASCGKPVLCQENLEGYSDEVLKYNLGITTDFECPNDTAKNIVSYFDGNRRSYYLENNRKQVLENLSWTERMQIWINFVKGLK